MITVSVVLLPAKTEKDYIINIRLTYARKSKYVSLGYKVEKHQFRENVMQGWVVRHPDAIFTNQIIEDKRRKAVEAITSAEVSGKIVSLDDIVAAIKGNNKGVITGSFIKAITDKANTHYANDAVNAYYKYKGLADRVMKAWGRDYSPSQVDNILAEKFIEHRRRTGTHENTIRKDLSFLATVWDSVLHTGANPFRILKKSIKPVPTKKHKLSPEEIGAIEKAKLVGPLDLARDMFLFSFYTQGMRFENVALMPKETMLKQHISYQMNKGKKHREIAFHPRLKLLVKKYFNSPGILFFPLVKKIPKSAMEKRDIIGEANYTINQALKLVAASAGLNLNLTFHLARHSFAHAAKTKNVPMAVLQQALGHSSIRTTEIYVGSLSDDVINAAIKGVYE